MIDKLRTLALATAVALASATAALAQYGGPPTPLPVGIFGATASLSVTSSTGNVAIPAGSASENSVLIQNDGTAEVFVKLGSNAVTAATTDFPLQAGASVSTYVGASTNVAAITSTGSSTLRVTRTNGAVSGMGGGGGGGGSGGGGAVYGPTAAGSPAANPPVVIGGTSDGTGTGNVGALKVAAGVAYVNCANCSGSGVSETDQAAFTAGSSLFAAGGGFYQTTATSNPLTTGQMGLFQVTAQRALFTNLRNSSGTEIGTSSNPIVAAGAGTAGSPSGGVISIQGVGSGTAVPVSGTFYQATQPVSIASAQVASGAFASGSLAAGSMVDLLTMRATIAGTGSEPADVLAQGCQYNSALPTFTATYVGGVQCDASGRQIVVGGGVAGTPAGGVVSIQGVSSGTAVPVSGTFYQATQPMSIASAQVASGAFASGSLAAGSMVDLLTMRATIAGTGSEPADVLAQGCQYSSSLPTFTNTFVGGAQCDASGRQITVGAGAAGTAAGGVVTVQGVASMTPVQVSQATAASLNATVVGTGTFAVQATLQASATTAIGKVDPNTIATWGLMSGTTPGTAPTNTLITGGIYNSSPPGPTTGQTLPFQLDSAGNLNVNIKAGAGSGGTALADGATFTEASTSFTPVGGEYVSGGGASCTTGKGCTVQMTIDRMAYVNIGKVGGAATGTAGSAGTGVLTVQGIASMTPVLANPGTIATWGLAALGGATAPTNAQSVAGEYLSSPPTYTNGQAGVLQMTAAGSLHTTVDNTNANGSDGSASIASGGTAQNLFSGSTPTHGWEICNPNVTDDLWVSQSTTAAVNGQGSMRIAANGGCVSSPAGMAPFHAISVIGSTTGDKITAVQW